jgi:hypothetical protein
MGEGEAGELPSDLVVIYVCMVVMSLLVENKKK